MTSSSDEPRPFSFQFLRPPGRRYTFESLLIAADAQHILLEHEAFPSKPLTIDGLEVMAAGYRVVWFLFKDCPYDVGRFYRPDGTWTGYYVDVLEPVRWRDGEPDTLEPIVDLFLDLWITPGGTVTVLDEDEFEDADKRGVLSSDQVRHARAVLDELVRQTEAGVFPPEIVRDFDR